MNGRMLGIAGLALAAGLVAATGRADDSRYREYALGSRAAGMGGAALALANDMDAAFHNPAGIAGSPADSLSLSASLYGLDRWELKNGFYVGDDASGESFLSVPSAMGGVKRLSRDWTGAFGVFTPKMERRRILAAEGGKTRFHNFTLNDQTIWAGPSIAWGRPDGKWRAGAGVFGVFREFSRSTVETFEGEGSVSSACDLNAFGVMASLGVQADLGNGWSAGATLQSPNLGLASSGKFSINYAIDHSSQPASGGMFSDDVKADNRTPGQLGVGVAKTAGAWTFAADALWHPAAHYRLMKWNFDGEEQAVDVHLQSVVDASLGAEVLLAGKYPLRAGFFTAFSGARRQHATDNGADELASSDVDLYGLTCSIGRRKGPVTLDVGLQYMWGRGKELGYSDQNAELHWMPCRREAVLCSVSTGYVF